MFGLKQPFGASYSVSGDDVLSMKSALTKTGDYRVPKTGLTPWTDDAVFDGMRKFQKRHGLTVDGVAKPGGPTEATLKSVLVGSTPSYESKTLEPNNDFFAPWHLRPSDSIGPKRVSGPSTLEMTPDKPKGKPHTWEMRPEYRERFKPVAFGRNASHQNRLELGRILTLIDSVGDKLGNKGQDVEGVKQTLALTGHYPNDPAKYTNPTPDEDLTWGIRRFQSEFGLKQDGLLRPGGETESKMNQIATPLVQEARLGKNEPEIAPMSDETQQPEKLSPEARRRARHGDRSGIPTPENPKNANPEPDIEWEEKPAISGHRGDIQINTDGPFKVDLSSATIGIDGLRYSVDWYTLDEHGKVVPEYRNPKPFLGRHPALQSGDAISFGKPHVFSPPFKSEHGYRAIIHVMPSEAINGNSAGVDMNFFPAKGGKISRVRE
jgi:peptidoglycan hydrolase-like protein with peptidoglycan-binding domain